MQRYIEQLIGDLREITGPENLSERADVDVVHDDETFFKHIENVENYLHGEQKPVSEITGILPEQLPPPEKLSEKQQAQLAVELENFLAHFHFALDFPHNYPDNLRYPFIKKFWKEEHVPLTFGESHIEFCDYDKENCPFQGYCTICDEIETDFDTDIENNSKNDDSNIPF